MSNNFITLTRHRLAADIITLWRDGVRQPDISRTMQSRYPMLTLSAFNEAATDAWMSLTDEERHAAAVADGVVPAESPAKPTTLRELLTEFFRQNPDQFDRHDCSHTTDPAAAAASFFADRYTDVSRPAAVIVDAFSDNTDDVSRKIVAMLKVLK